MKKFVLLWIIACLLQGCLTQHPVLSQEGVFIVWKTPVMKYADQGFLYHEAERLRLEIYANAQAVLKLEVTPTQVCTRGICMSKKEFNLRYLSPYYPETLLDNLLRGRVIFAGEGIQKGKNGFTQMIVKQGFYAIEYRVFSTSIVFLDKINHIVIKIKKES